MQMVHANDKLSAVFKTAAKELNHELPSVFFDFEIKEKAEALQEKYSFSDTTLRRLIRSGNRLDLMWNKRSSGSLYTFESPKEVGAFAILEAWSRQRGVYLSHYTALYLNKLVLQRPKDYFLTRERPGKSGVSSSMLDQFRIRQAFLKPARMTQNFFAYGESKYFLLEKVWLNGVGLKEISFRNEHQTYQLRVTSLERTFLDCIIAPQYAGGIPTVVKAFVGTKLDIDSLIRLYETLDPTYPYWQSIGFILEQLGQSVEAKAWEAHFKSREKIPFYIEHGAKSFWKFSDRWQLYYPNGAFLGLGN